MNGANGFRKTTQPKKKSGLYPTPKALINLPFFTFTQLKKRYVLVGLIVLQRKLTSERLAQRFSPRRPKSNWTELNKERAKRLIQNGKMTEAGLKVLPDLSPNSFQIPEDILEALQNDVQTWNNFQQFPDVYKRIRIGYIEEVRKQSIEFQKRLDNFLKKTRENKMFGIVE